MPKISRTTNPTNLKELHAKHFSVRVQVQPNGSRSFWLERFNLGATGLPNGLNISCVAHAGNTEEFFRLGTVDKPDHSMFLLHEIASNRPLKFRFLISEKNNPKLIAFVDNVKPADESGLLGSSLIDIEPSDLGGAAWELVISEVIPGADRPVLLVERNLFSTAQAAARHTWVGVLVMPEVMRQIAKTIVENRSSLEDTETWLSSWSEFLTGLGVSELPLDEDKGMDDKWVDEVVSAFCAKVALKAHIDRAVIELMGGSL